MLRYAFALVALVIAGAIFFWYTKPTYDSTQTVKDEIAQYDQALAKAAELQKLKDDLLARFKSFTDADKERIGKLLPDHVDNIALILDLDALAAKHKMPIENVDVSVPASSAVSEGGVTTLGGSGQKYDSVTIRFSTRGTYEEFQVLLRDLEMALRVVDLVSLSLAPSTNADEKASGQLTYGYDLTLRTYWLH